MTELLVLHTERGVVGFMWLKLSLADKETPQAPSQTEQSPRRFYFLDVPSFMCSVCRVIMWTNHTVPHRIGSDIMPLLMAMFICPSLCLSVAGKWLGTARERYDK